MELQYWIRLMNHGIVAGLYVGRIFETVPIFKLLIFKDLYSMGQYGIVLTELNNFRNTRGFWLYLIRLPYCPTVP